MMIENSGQLTAKIIAGEVRIDARLKATSQVWSNK